MILGAYPPSFRRRYGDELTGLVADGHAGWRDTVDLVRGAGHAWVSPVFGGPPAQARRARLQATTVTVLAAWCASLVAGAGFAKSVDDPRLPGLHGAAWAAYTTGSAALQVLAAVVLASGFAVWLLVVVPAGRAHRRDVLVPALAPAVVAALWLGVTGLVALFAHHVVRRGNVALTWPRGAVVLAVLVAYAAVTLACVVGCATGAAVALRRAELSAPRLARTAVVAVLAALGVAVEAVAAVVCLVQLWRPGGGLDPRDGVFSAGAAAVLVAAAVVAAVSASRAVAVLRPGPPGAVGDAA
jgi:hypothetical protein